MALQISRELVDELTNLLTLDKSRPYIFRTRLERALVRTATLARKTNNLCLEKKCAEIRTKLNYLSDQSTHTSDGTLNSFIVLQPDIKVLLHDLCEIKM